MYLNNNILTQSDDDIDDDQQQKDFNRQRLEAKRRELIENCKHIRSIFENDFHPHDDNDSSSYLDMNGASNKNRQAIKHVASDEHTIGMF